jgi:hypothetical protein
MRVFAVRGLVDALIGADRQITNRSAKDAPQEETSWKRNW